MVAPSVLTYHRTAGNMTPTSKEPDLLNWLLMAKCFNRIEGCGSDGGVDSKRNANRDGDGKGQGNRSRNYDGRSFTNRLGKIEYQVGKRLDCKIANDGDDGGAE